MNFRKRKEGPLMQPQLSKPWKKKSSALSAIQPAVPNRTTTARLQHAARLPSEVTIPTYEATSPRSPKFMGFVLHFSAASQAFASIDSLVDYASSSQNVSVSARQPSGLSNHISGQDGLSASAIDPSLDSFDLPYGKTSYPPTQTRGPGSDPTSAIPTRLVIRSDTLSHFKPDIVLPELSQDSAAILPNDFIDRKQPMVDPNSLQTEQPGYSNMTADYERVQYPPAADMSSQPANQVPDFPSVCFLCPQATGQVQSPIFNTVDDYNVHLWESHSDLSTWTLKKCIWRGRTTVCTFATAKLWFAHVHQVHQKMFYCTLPNCKYRRGGPEPKPFGSQNGLDRHLKSKSHARPVLCDKPHCTSRQNLARKDKKTKHDAEFHGRVLCPSVGCNRGLLVDGVCYGFASPKDLLAHQEAKHATETAIQL